MESKALAKYFATSDSAQHSRRCLEIFHPIPLAETSKPVNLTLEEVDDIIDIWYHIDE